ncbi:hypothetical protein JOQ06_016469, partial [Pogonophryne albipinna]
MVDLFLNRVLVENNTDQDELNTEREIVGILENRILMLFFASSECENCQEFLPVLNDFFKRLKDPAYIEYPKLLALVYISLDKSEAQQERFLNELHKKVLFLAFEDPYRNELKAMFKVKSVPTVVVLRPDGSVLSPNAVQDICSYGTDCFRDWQESAEVIERSFMLNEDFDNLNMRSATDPVRRLKQGRGETKGEGVSSYCRQASVLVPVNMVDLFVDRVLLKNNKEQDELDTEREIVMRLQNRILMLFFASAACERCQQFTPTISNFFKRLTDEFYVDRAAQLVLVYISLDQTEEEQESFLKELPKRCLFLAYEDPYRRSELQAMFNVEELPTVVVLRPDCSILIPNAAEEILCLGPDCYRNWQEAAEIIDRNFLINEDFEVKSMCSWSDPMRRLKYRFVHASGREEREKGRRVQWVHEGAERRDAGDA